MELEWRDVMSKPVVMFVCKHNARSPMAAAILRHAAPDAFEVYSAGTEPADAIHPLTATTLAERGIELGASPPQSVKDFLGRVAVSEIIVLCREDEECARVWPGVRTRIFWPLANPLAAPPAEQPAAFRDLCDELERRIDAWLEERLQTRDP